MSKHTKYNHSEKGQARYARYAAKQKAKARHTTYNESPKGLKRKLRFNISQKTQKLSQLKSRLQELARV